MPKPIQITPNAKPLKNYYAALKDFAHQEVAQEQAVRSAFQYLLTELAKPLKWTAIPEHGKKFRGKRIIPDGTLKDKYQLPRGYWEAKDAADDLDDEIRQKRAKGYPLNNTIFWTPTRAVLFQDGVVKHDLAIEERNGQPGAFCDLLTSFFTYVDKPLVDFDDAVEDFTARVPEVGKKLAEIIAEEHKRRGKFEAAFLAFFELCKTTLNPNISRAAVDEMLVQHLLTVRLFRSVFNNPEFLRMNVIAVEVEKVIDALASRSFNRDEFLQSLDRFYVAIENAAARVPDWSSKQAFLNTIYERFFQGYCVKTADTHGIVYTPQPIVDFMCASVERVLEQEFGKKLGDEGVNILDPCTGTGNFVVNLMRRVADRGPKHLKRMYVEQLFANEIMLMPYYIAALNIEHEYFEHVGQYESFEGLCFVDTLDMAQAAQLELITEKNLERVLRQKRSAITVVIGNPPYNANQKDETDDNANRKYPVIDQRIRYTYAASSQGTLKNKLYDSYVRFFRWAVDRLGQNDGVVCMVTNNSFVVDYQPFDGMRHHLAKDFCTIYHVDLNGNVRQNPKLSGTKHNVFGIQTGVGITVAVRKTKSQPSPLSYFRVPEEWSRFDKLSWLDRHVDISGVRWQRHPLGEDKCWLRPEGAAAFARLLPLEAARGKLAPKHGVFVRCGPGAKSNRDAVVYDFDSQALYTRVIGFANRYNAELDRFKRQNPKRPEDVSMFYRGSDLEWSSTLKLHLQRLREMLPDRKLVRPCLYRPFTKISLYFDDMLNDRPGIARPGLDIRVPDPNRLAIHCTGHSQVPFSAIMTCEIPNEAVGGRAGTCFPLHLFNDSQTDNITTWALKVFRSHFAIDAKTNRAAMEISKSDIFYYIYSILHHPGYCETFAENLKRELPRVPLASTIEDFNNFVKAGRKLSKIHTKYDDESVIKPYPLKEVWTRSESGGSASKMKDYRISDKMKLSKDMRSLRVNSTLTLEGIPSEISRYRVGNRSALEWIIDQYQVYTDPKTHQVSDCNAWGEERDDPEYIVRLIKQIVTVSLETIKIIDALPKDFGGPPRVSVEQPEPDEPQAPSESESEEKPKSSRKKWKLSDEKPKTRQGKLRK